MVVDFSFPWNKKQNLCWRGNTSGDSQGQRKLEPVEVSDVFCIVSILKSNGMEWNVSGADQENFLTNFW